MASSERPKDDDHLYASIPAYRDASLSDLDSDLDEVQYKKPQRSRKCRNLVAVWLAVVCLLSLYTLLVAYVTSNWWRRERIHGAGVVETPLRPWIKYKPEIFPQRHWSNEYPLVGQPSDERDARWRHIMSNFYTEVPYSYMEKMGRLDEGIQLENGNFLATYSVIHLLHCVKRLHESYFPDRYFPNMTQSETELQLEHNLHCLQMVVQAIMCQADIVPITTVWLDNTPLPSGNRHVEHECVDFDLMIEGIRAKRVDPFARPEIFVHPIFGPVINEERNGIVGDDRIGYGHMGKVLKVDGEGVWRVGE
ncbi:uncharacterized protein MYCFIDRAFT_212040 [Pseudocercospora fijiensis CIRAD86]|uniref:Tat pathway signal sequence n=1 Tax=Pseudocercospora fijiensis (strain CIRAD86) TaxID=383855 RepID=M2ZMN1_PSEFD|nr:uncharacterized protein MYCFIDRAFT_212040 [Pseudocercospora fijiensis CIRAD86]EME80349.1 hypothetical protein MYCFIDRAFT_212040 [Pseudocercospora fijiensis CIRAD86]